MLNVEIIKFYFLNHGYEKNLILQDENEWNEFIEFISNYEIKYGLEIGSYNGGTFYTLCQMAISDAVLINIDPLFGEYKNLEIRNKLFNSFKKENQIIHNINGLSQDLKIIDKVKDILNGNKLDYLFIDGNHEYLYCKKDFDNYEPLVKNGGVIIFHDIKNISCYGPYKLWKEIKEKYKVFEICKYNNQLGIGIIIKKRIII